MYQCVSARKRSVGRKRTGALAITVVLCLGPFRAQGQQQINSATLSGRLTDSSGAPVGSATITVTSGATDQKTVKQSDDAGRYRFGRLGPWRLYSNNQQIWIFTCQRAN